MPKTPAERSREYRARLKIKIQEQQQQGEQIQRPKSSAERVRAYRARRKAEINKNKLEESKRKTSAERTRVYRVRKKLERMENQVEIEDYKISIKVENDSNYDCYGRTEKNYCNQIKQGRAKTSAERTRDYRARRKAENNKNKLKERKPKSGAERMRAYRARKKLKRMQNQVEIEDYKISIKVEYDSDYDCYEPTEIKDEKWDFVEKESSSFLNSQGFGDDYSGQVKVEVKEEPAPTISEMGPKLINDQNNIKKENPIENVEEPSTSSLQPKLPLPLTDCQLPPNSILLLIPSAQGTSSSPPTLLNLNMLSPANLANILPNPFPLLNLNVKPPEGNTPSGIPN